MQKNATILYYQKNSYYVIELPTIGSLEYVLECDDNDNNYSSSFAYIISVFIIPSQRRQGWGTFLVKKLVDTLKKQHVYKIKLDNVLVKRNKFYKKLGFVFTRSDDNEMCLIFNQQCA